MAFPKIKGLTLVPTPVPTIDGRNPAPVDMENLPLFTGFYVSQVVGTGISQPSTVWTGRFFSQRCLYDIFSYTSLKLTFAPLKICLLPPIGKDRIPTIHEFRCVLVSFREEIPRPCQGTSKSKTGGSSSSTFGRSVFAGRQLFRLMGGSPYGPVHRP